MRSKKQRSLDKIGSLDLKIRWKIWVIRNVRSKRKTFRTIHESFICALVTEISSSLICSRRKTWSVRLMAFYFPRWRNVPFTKSISFTVSGFTALNSSISSSLDSSSPLIHQIPIMVQPRTGNALVRFIGQPWTGDGVKTYRQGSFTHTNHLRWKTSRWF